MGAGIMTLIANPQYTTYLVYFQTGAASDTFIGGESQGDRLVPCLGKAAPNARMGHLASALEYHLLLTLRSPTNLHHHPRQLDAAGWLTSIRNIRWQFQLIYGQQGIGNQIYIGAGGAIFINTYSYYKRLRYWTNWKYTYTLGGYGTKKTYYPKSTIKMTKDKVTVEYYDKEKNYWSYKSYKKGFEEHRYSRMLQGARLRPSCMAPACLPASLPACLAL